MFGFHKKKKFKPIIVEKEYGTFTMDCNHNSHDKPSYEYEGIVDWCGHETEVMVVIQTQDNLTADAGFARLSKLLADPAKAAELDRKIKERAFKEIVQEGYVDDIFYYQCEKGHPIENPEPITMEQFLEHFELRFIQVNEDMYDGCWVEFNFLIFYTTEYGGKYGQELSFFIDDDNNVADDFEMPGGYV